MGGNGKGWTGREAKRSKHVSGANACSELQAASRPGASKGTQIYLPFLRYNRMVELSDNIVKGTSDVVGGAFGGFVATLSISGVSNTVVFILSLILLLLMAGLYTIHEWSKQTEQAERKKQSVENMEKTKYRPRWDSNRAS